jgi:hypothetical protein
MPIKLNLTKVRFDISDDESQKWDEPISPTLTRFIKNVCAKINPLARESNQENDLSQNGSRTEIGSGLDSRSLSS